MSIILTTSLISGASSVFAVKEYVVNTNDSGTGSLRDVIQNANVGDTIIIDISGVLMLQSQIQINNSLTIIGPGPIHFRIDGSNVTVPLETGFVCHNGSDIYMEGIQFENFSQDPIASGGSYTGVFSVVGCAFDNSSATINVDGGNLNFSGCSFLNTSGSNPVVFVEANAIFLNCTFYNNAGGGVWVNNGSTDIVNCTFFQNGANVGSGLAIRQMAGTLNLRNNIIFNDTQTNSLIDVSGGTLNSQGGNITNDEVTTGSWVGTDIQSMSVNSGLAIGNKVKDGWGITYFPPTAGSDGIDIDIASNNLPLMDQRRVWRVMDGGVNGAAADAGAVEYSRFTVTSTGTGPGSLWSAWNRYDTLSFSGKAAIVFELGGAAPFLEGGGSIPMNFSKDSTIINGFSQDSSKVPGPGSTPGTLISGYTPVELVNPISSFYSAMVLNGNNSILAGLSIGGFDGYLAEGVAVYGSNHEISGCHIGVNATGNSIVSNSRGVLVEGSSASVSIGSGKYCGKNHHANRNVISGNQGVQIKITSSSFMKISNNIIGLDGIGLNKPTGSTFVADTGISTSLYAYIPGSGVLIGSHDIRDRNVIGDQSRGIVLMSNNNKVFNNFIGSDYTGNNVGATTPNDYGIEVADPWYTYYVDNNLIGEQDKGNVIVGSVNKGVVLFDVFNNRVFANKVGVGLDGLTPLGNGFAGIYVDGFNAYDNQIGAPGKGNVISDNGLGIELSSSSYHSIVRSNLIGVGKDSITTLGNANQGIYVWSSSANNAIGGCNPGDGNVIGANNNGIVFEGSGADNDTVMGNYIGVNPAGDAIGNSSAGISFLVTINNIKIGDVGPGCGNEIAYNGVGVQSDGSGASEIHISGNSFHDNTGIGIDLDNDGQNPTGANGAPFDNNGAQTPSLISAVDCGGTVSLGIQLEVNEDVIIEVFKAADGQEGDSLIVYDTINFTSGITEYIPFSALPVGTDIVVTATYDGGGGFKNTSEFSSPISITAGTLPAVTIVGQDSICEGQSEEFSVANVAGATYNWFLYGGYDPFDIPGAIDTNVIVVDAVPEPFNSTDSLIVEVNDAGCIARDTMALYQLFPPFVDYDSVIQPVTCGGFGEIYLATYEPNTNYTVYYNGGTTINATTLSSYEGMFPITGLTPGTYNIDSISNGVCFELIGNVYTIVEPTPQTVYAGPDQTDCEGSTITLSATPSGGSGSFTYSWDNGGGSGQTVNVTPVASTEYIVTCTDDITLCEARDTVTVNINALPLVSIVAPPVICDGDVHTYDATVSGSGPFNYNWVQFTDFATSSVEDATTTVRLPGTYSDTLFVSDANGCINFESVSLTVNPTPDGGNPLVTDVICGGGATGAITLMPMGAYTYSWTGPSGFTSTDQDITNLFAGSYSVTITDGDGCTGSAAATVNEPTPLSYVTSVIDVSCNGLADGSIDFSVSGGTSPYEYSVDNGATFSTTFTNTATATGLAPGNVDCMVRDANGCLANSLVIVGEPAELNFTLVIKDDTCSLAKGEIQFVPTGGTIPYQYSIDAGATYQTTDTYSGLLNGGYSLDVIDANGCVTSTFTTLNDQSGVSVVVNGYSTQVSCFDSFDGFIDVLTTDPFGGGVVYDWSYNASPGFATTEDINSLYGGDYELIATDIGGCKDTLPVTINTPPQLLMSVTVIDETCSGYSDGQLDTTGVSGGSFPLSLDWIELPASTNIGTTAPLTGVSTGDYVGLITDANGCTASDTVTVSAGESYTPAISMFYTDSCINNNSFDFVDGGSGPSSGAASYNWIFTNATPSSSTIPNPTGVVFNFVSLQGVVLELTSNSGCLFKDTVYADIYDTATVALTPMDISCFGANDGSVTASATGGFGPYQYSFNGGVPAAVNSINGLGAGTVTCYVIDTYSGCQSTTHSVGVAEPSQITFTATISDATCGDSNGQVIFQNVTGGTGTYTYSVDGSNYVASNPITGLAPGTYDYYVQDASGCVEAQNSNTIGNVGNPVPTPTIQEGTPFIVCYDNSGSYGELTAISNDVSTGTFEWYVGSLGNIVGTNGILQLDDFTVGNHYIYLTESNGNCESTPDSVLLDVVVNDAVNNTISEICLGEEVLLDVSTSGGFTWFDTLGEIADVNSTVSSALPASLPRIYFYEVLIGDCIFQDSVQLIENTDCGSIVIDNNAFSPNGDGVNDLFKIDIGALANNTNKVTIINRWGDIINEYDNYDNLNVAWDGTNKSQEPVPSGTYFYVVEIPDIDLKTTGWIQVVR